MLVFTRANFTLFAVPKTGSTAYHLALRNHAQIVLSQDTSLKHMSMRKYEVHFAPWLKEAHGYDPERVAVMRNPIEHLRSWYRYRMRPKVRGGPRDLTGLTFDQFVADVISDAPPEHARIGDQRTFLSHAGRLGVDHLFAYERPDLLMAFLKDRLGEKIEPKRRNVSPDVPAPLSQEMEEALIAARPEEWALYEAMMIAGGHLHTPVTGAA
ncbi:hypothetical protein ATO6_07755 [Oceanicola sp. 22II-s10i]|uniref:hypothetical protein n=1 Tax=Oceanicola sp. 22II-s10i TaxID=1317116 RepID=UPI000B523EA8|nr:hypothetical protein [Oceanicola sp. 22II-s10i]OWU86660.1 hypothetical protein ATO6_07755 [Oceanicola sp. 22II-s10i]